MWQQFVWYRNLLIGLPAARLKKGLICVRLTAPPVLLTVAGERCIAEVDMAEFIFGLLVGLAAAMISRSYFARLGMPVPLDHIRVQFREALRRGLAKPQAPQVAVTSEVLPLAEPAEPLAIHLRRLESIFLPIADNAAHPREFLDQPSFLEAAALLTNEA